MSPNVACRRLVLSMNLKSTCWAAVSESKCEVERALQLSFCCRMCLSLSYLGQSNRKWWTVSTWLSSHWRQFAVTLFLIRCMCLFSRMWPVRSWMYMAVCFFRRRPASFRNDLGVCFGFSASMWLYRGDFCHSFCHFSCRCSSCACLIAEVLRGRRFLSDFWRLRRGLAMLLLRATSFTSLSANSFLSMSACLAIQFRLIDALFRSFLSCRMHTSYLKWSSK